MKKIKNDLFQDEYYATFTIGKKEKIVLTKESLYILKPEDKIRLFAIMFTFSKIINYFYLIIILLDCMILTLIDFHTLELRPTIHISFLTPNFI